MGAAVASARAAASSSRRPPRVIVVDGGSSDGTAKAAKRAGARVVRSRRGRGAQLAAGVVAAASSSPAPSALLFLHADSRLPPDYAPRVAAALARAPWGAFATARPTDLPRPLAAFLAACIEARTRVFGLPYGDQALFCRAGALKKVGSFNPNLPLMEDVDLVDRLTATCGRPAVVPVALATSGRRWAARGVVRATAANLWTLARWRAGADAAELAREYYGK